MLLAFHVRGIWSCMSDVDGVEEGGWVVVNGIRTLPRTLLPSHCGQPGWTRDSIATLRKPTLSVSQSFLMLSTSSFVTATHQCLFPFGAGQVVQAYIHRTSWSASRQ